VVILAQRQPDLPRAITRVILVISLLDELHEILVADGAPGTRPAAGVVISGRGKCAAQLSELGAHRLDPESVLVLVDETDDYRSGRSSSAAKKIEAAFSISFARRNSRFSARSLRTSADSSLAGHLEAGEIEFRAEPEGDALHFEIESWARAGDRLSALLYNKLRLAKEIQLNMWSHFCLRAASLAGGRAQGGITIRTRWVPWD
jgi:hypothetical protein